MALIKIRDEITISLQERVAAVRDRTPLLEAMGQAVKSLGIQAFTSPEKRAQAWVRRKDGEPHALLQKSTMLRKSLRIVKLTNNEVRIGSDRPYAAIHQLGGTIEMKARQSVIHFKKEENSNRSKFSKVKGATHAQKVTIGPHLVVIPARPYLPFYKTGQMTALGRQRVERALVAALRARGF